MPLSNFSRRRDYFSSLTSVKAESIDREFNKVAEYLNQGIIASLNNIINSTVPGSLNINDMNKFFQTSNGSLKWGKITNDIIKFNSVSPVKLAKYNPGSVLVADTDKQLKPVTPVEDNQTLVSSLASGGGGFGASWRKLTSDNLADGAILGRHVAHGTITNTNINPNLFSTVIPDNSITGNNFKNSSITTIKLARGNQGLTLKKLTPEVQGKIANTLFTNMIPDNSITRLYIDFNFPGGIVFESLNRFQLTLPQAMTELRRIFSPTSKTPIRAFYPFSPENLVLGHIRTKELIKNNSIDGRRLAELNAGGGLIRCRTEILQDGIIEIDHFTPEIQQKLR